MSMPKMVVSQSEDFLNTIEKNLIIYINLKLLTLCTLKIPIGFASNHL